MITRAQMPRQLRNTGGITNAVPREKYGLGSKLKDRFRKLIPNELADIAVKAAPFVAPFNPGIAGLMRGIGRFDQRGSISDALKQGVATFGFGAGARALGGASDIFGGGLKGGFTSPLNEGRTTAIKNLFTEKDTVLTKEQMLKKKKDSGFLGDAAEKVFEKVPFSDKISTKVKEKLLVGTITSGASALYSYFTGEFEPQEPGETVGEYMARRRERVKSQMRQVMDSYYTPLRNPSYAAMSDEEKDNFIDGIVGQTELEGTTDYQGMATGGRVGYGLGNLVTKSMPNTTASAGGVTMANTLAENIRRNLANQAAVAEQFRQARKNIPGYVEPQRTPVQEYAMGEDSILGPLSKKAASTIIEGQDKSRAALDLLNKTSMEPSGIMTQTPTADTAQIPGTMDSLVNVNKQPTQTTDTVKIPRAKDPYYDGVREAFATERLFGGELFGDAIPGFDKFGTYTGDDPFLKEYYESGRGTPSSQLVKLPADNPYAVNGAGYYLYTGTGTFNKVADENPTPESMKFLRSQYLPSLAKGGMPTGIMRTNKAGVMERDYRDKGGFVPVGIKEKADDVPAMLSKNEFVFTADAVRGAGNGSIEKGAQKMYDTMKKLEKRVV